MPSRGRLATTLLESPVALDEIAQSHTRWAAAMSGLADVRIVHGAPAGHVAPADAWIFAGLLIGLLVIGIWMMVYLARHLDDPEDDDGGGGGGGGGRGGGRGPGPTDPRPQTEPDWWPEFERQFAAYIQHRRAPTR